MNIIVYVKTGCPWCIGLTDLLKEKNISFEERNVTSNPEFFKEMQEKSGQTLAPTLDIDGEIIPDSSAEEITEYFKSKGVKGF